MNVNKQSIIYKFMNEGFLLRDERIPDNLCPFMRRFVTGVLLTFLLFFTGSWMAQSMFFLPFIALSGYFSGDFYSVQVVVWGAFGYVFLFVYWFVCFCKRVKAAYSALRKTTKADVVVRARDAAYDSLFGHWIKAVHDKACPTLTFASK